LFAHAVQFTLRSEAPGHERLFTLKVAPCRVDGNLRSRDAGLINLALGALASALRAR
jgi:hypothetical protein